jgi:hypothetical protein
MPGCLAVERPHDLVLGQDEAAAKLVKEQDRERLLHVAPLGGRSQTNPLPRPMQDTAFRQLSGGGRESNPPAALCTAHWF